MQISVGRRAPAAEAGNLPQPLAPAARAAARAGGGPLVSVGGAPAPPSPPPSPPPRGRAPTPAQAPPTQRTVCVFGWVLTPGQKKYQSQLSRLLTTCQALGQGAL